MASVLTFTGSGRAVVNSVIPGNEQPSVLVAPNGIVWLVSGLLIFSALPLDVQAEPREPPAQPERLVLSPLAGPVGAATEACPRLAESKVRIECWSVGPAVPPQSRGFHALVDTRTVEVVGLAERTQAGWFVHNEQLRGLGWNGYSTTEIGVGSWRIITGSAGFADGAPPEVDFFACEHFFTVCQDGERPLCSQVIRLGRLPHCGPPWRCDSMAGVRDDAGIISEGLAAASTQERPRGVYYRLGAQPPAAKNARTIPLTAMDGPFQSNEEWCKGGSCAAKPFQKADATEATTNRFEAAIWITGRPRRERRYLAISSGGVWFVQRAPLVVDRRGGRIAWLSGLEHTGDTLLVKGSRGYAESAYDDAGRTCSLFFVGCRQGADGRLSCSAPVTTAKARRCYPPDQCQWWGDAFDPVFKQIAPNVLQVGARRFEVVP